MQAGGREGVINITMNVAGSRMERDFACKVGRGKPCLGLGQWVSKQSPGPQSDSWDKILKNADLWLDISP